MSIKITRRNLIISGSALMALGFMARRSFLDTYGKRSFKGKVIGANFKRGHRLLTKDFPAPTKTIRNSISIVGTGVSGLSCAYHLRKKGYEDVALYELEDHVGGKSAGMNGLAPWGAHYLPLVNSTNGSLLSFLEDIGVVKDTRSERPFYNELAICSDPMEKLYIYGRLQEGIIPKQALTQTDKDQFDRFWKYIETFKNAKGNDGKFAFEIPIESSSKDKRFLDLDSITMEDYLKKEKFNSKPLLWYVNYCCRDDFGGTTAQVSAWAGIHYFAARRGQGRDIHDDSVMTWPEGNNFLVNKLKQRANYQINNAHMLFDIKSNEMLFYDFKNKETVKVISEQVVLALPQFIINRVLGTKATSEYSAWMVANIKVRWDQQLESLLAWDNVNYHGKGLGFVVSGHQNLKTKINENTLTYYWPLTHLDPKDARRFALKRTHEQWSEDVIKDIEPVIPDIRERIEEINIWPWGHGMVLPRPGYISERRQEARNNETSSLHFAHTDLSGLSLFEEGFYQGERAAMRVAKSLGSIT